MGNPGLHSIAWGSGEGEWRGRGRGEGEWEGRGSKGKEKGIREKISTRLRNQDIIIENNQHPYSHRPQLVR